MKVSVAVAFLAMLGILTPPRTAAANPPPKSDLFCPAVLARVLPIHQTEIPANEHDLGTDSEFSVEVEADTPETVSGTLAILSGKSEYKVPFKNQTLSAVTYTTKLGDKVLSRVTRYRSVPIFVALPAALPVEAVWILDISQNGRPASCAALPVVWERPVARRDDDATTQDNGLTVQDVRSRMPANVSVARPDPAFTRGECARLSAYARVTSVAPLSYPAATIISPATVLVTLAINAAGKVVDSEIAQTSGYQELDNIALASAVRTKYAPAEFLCSPIPGFYVFRAVFSP